jgi:hypothetical protein
VCEFNDCEPQSLHLRRRPIAASESHGATFLLETHKNFLPRCTRE